MFTTGTLLKTNIGFEFEVLEPMLNGSYKAKCNNLALFICVMEKVVTDRSGKFLGVIESINYIVEGEYHEQVSTKHISGESS